MTTRLIERALVHVAPDECIYEPSPEVRDMLRALMAEPAPAPKLERSWRKSAGEGECE